MAHTSPDSDVGLLELAEQLRKEFKALKDKVDELLKIKDGVLLLFKAWKPVAAAVVMLIGAAYFVGVNEAHYRNNPHLLGMVLQQNKEIKALRSDLRTHFTK